MPSLQENGRRFWLSVGLVAGLAISFVWPHQPVAGAVGDRNDKFAMVTARVDITNFVDGVFVLDFLTGQLRGGVLSPRSGQFVALYSRNIAADFNVNPNQEATYAIVSGRMTLNSSGGDPAASIIYVAELTSGKVAAYSFPTGGTGVAPLVPLDTFSFRPSIQ